MAVEQILKSWLRQKYTDNNTLKVITDIFRM